MWRCTYTESDTKVQRVWRAPGASTRPDPPGIEVANDELDYSKRE